MVCVSWLCDTQSSFPLCRLGFQKGYSSLFKYFVLEFTKLLLNNRILSMSRATLFWNIFTHKILLLPASTLISFTQSSKAKSFMETFKRSTNKQGKQGKKRGAYFSGRGACTLSLKCVLLQSTCFMPASYEKGSINISTSISWTANENLSISIMIYPLWDILNCAVWRRFIFTRLLIMHWRCLYCKLLFFIKLLFTKRCFDSSGCVYISFFIKRPFDSAGVVSAF